jgi:hypothetical protein
MSKAKNIKTRFATSNKWLIVKQGRYNRFPNDKYIKATSLGGFNKGYKYVIVAGFKKRSNIPHLSLQQLPREIFYSSNEELKDDRFISLFDSMLVEYQKKWEEKRIAKKAKYLLSEQ